MSITLTLTDVDEKTILALQKRADAHGRSIEEEHREILKDALVILKRVPLADVLKHIENIRSDSDFKPPAHPE